MSKLLCKKVGTWRIYCDPSKNTLRIYIDGKKENPDDWRGFLIETYNIDNAKKVYHSLDRVSKIKSFLEVSRLTNAEIIDKLYKK